MKITLPAMKSKILIRKCSDGRWVVGYSTGLDLEVSYARTWELAMVQVRWLMQHMRAAV